MRLPSGRTMGSLGASSASESQGRGSGARSPSAATSSSCRRAAVIALMRELLSYGDEVVAAEAAVGRRGGSAGEGDRRGGQRDGEQCRQAYSRTLPVGTR